MTANSDVLNVCCLGERINAVHVSLARYIGLIRKRNGFAGLYTGLAPRLAAMGLTQKVEEEFDKYWPPPEEEEERKKERADIDGDEDDEEAALARLAILLHQHNLGDFWGDFLGNIVPGYLHLVGLFTLICGRRKNCIVTALRKR